MALQPIWLNSFLNKPTALGFSKSPKTLSGFHEQAAQGTEGAHTVIDSVEDRTVQRYTSSIPLPPTLPYLSTPIPLLPNATLLFQKPELPLWETKSKLQSLFQPHSST